MLIIRDMLFFNKTSYGDFMDSPEGISTNILATRLKQLEANGIIAKHIDTKDRKKSIYLLTNKGIELAPLLIEMLLWGYDWASKQDDRPAVMRDIVKRLKEDKMATMAPFIEKYRIQKTELIG